MSSVADWKTINLQMIAKSLQELTYEQVIQPVRVSACDESKVGPYELTLSSQVVYRFKAWRGIWTDLKVEANSITRNGQAAESAGQFFIDCQKETGMDDIILANFLEEMHNTLYADVHVLEKNRHTSSAEMVKYSGEKIQTFLKGHPKILLNKGRIGWSAADQDLYGPENAKPVQFYWLAVRKTQTLEGLDSHLTWNEVLAECISELTDFERTLSSKNLEAADFHFVPVHPWQWERYIKIQYATDLAMGHLHFLGAFGDHYLPQISLRTFSNVTRPGKLDIKLPITILNTSAIRGIPGKYMKQGPALSSALTALCQQDEVLKDVTVLEEKAGLSVVHTMYAQVKEAPYRYHELLGVLWRQSSECHLQSDETAIIAGSLFHRDQYNQSLLGAYAQAAGLDISAWLALYFEKVFIPLYHLQARYGIGLVAHGQNVVIRLKNSTPVGVFLKDFQGDLRLSDDSSSMPGFDLTRLPRHYLIHDLLTGHLVTVLRFISETLQECDTYPEMDFYAGLGKSLKTYLENNPEIKALNYFGKIDLLQDNFHRVLVNKVRFKIGYADSAERPLPILGEDLRNPVALALKEANV